MSEVLSSESDAEQSVFGDAFSLSGGVNDEAVVSMFMAKRLSSVREGATTWLPRILDDDHGVCADLFKDRTIVATLMFDYDTNTATVYTTSEGGTFGDTTLCEGVSFSEAFAASEQVAA